MIFALLNKTKNFLWIKTGVAFLLNVLKKYFYSEKQESSLKKAGLLSNLLNKLGRNEVINIKKTTMSHNKGFFNEIQGLLKKSVGVLLKSIEGKEREFVIETLNYIEENEGVILDNSGDFMDFYYSFLYILYHFSSEK